MTPMTRLQEVIEEHESSPRVKLPPLPPLLPGGHLSDCREFKQQVMDWGISPTRCDVFLEDLVYMYYGGLFFRRSDNPIQQAAMYPVGFLFDPEVLVQCERVYPFDTGAIPKGIYGTKGPIVERWEDCRIDCRGDASHGPRLVQYLYGENHKYLKGIVSTTCVQLRDPFTWLIPFLRALPSLVGGDQRRYRIEYQSTVHVSFDSLLWVGYPDVYTPWFARVFERSKTSRPERYSYDSYRLGRPSEMAAVLQQAAVNYVRNRVDPFV
jgi:hypothetical protein